MYYVYIIYSNKLGKKYIGYSTNLKARLAEHNRGKATFSSRGADWKLIYYEVFKSEKDARREEQFLKTGKGRERLKFLLEETMKEIK